MAESFVQVALDGAGKKIRNIFLAAFAGNDVYQQVVSRAKSDGTLLDDEATETTLAAIKASQTALIGTLEARPAAYSVLDRLYQLGLKVDAGSKATAQAIAALR